MAMNEFFDEVQMMTESGGKQFAPDGSTLVGRRKDGSLPPPDQRAYGVGQMQMGTARNVAKAHGIPFDPTKFLRDRAYNLNLAELHQGDLERKYGDKTIARAAYHSGEPIVDRAIAKHGREGFARGLGPEGREYIRMGVPKAGVGNPGQFLAGLESTLHDEKKVGQTIQSDAKVTYDKGTPAELSARADKVEGNINDQGRGIEVLNDVTQVAQEAARGALTQQLSETTAISNEITEGTTELRKQVVPIFKARGRVADQLDKINTMNPLERGIRGIFDLNYDQDYLEGQLDHFDKTLQMRAQDYDYLNKLHGVALQEVDRRYNLSTAMPNLVQKQAEEDLGIVGMRITQTASSLGNLSDRIGTESRLIAAKQQAREDMLLRLDTPTITDLMTQAQEKGGAVSYNGVEFSYKELHDRVQAADQQDLQMESYRTSIAAGRMDLAERQAENIAKSLTRPQLEAAINNGGMYNGIQLPQDTLTQMYTSAVGRDQTRAADIANRMPTKMALETGADYLKQSMGLYSRSKSLFGNKAMEGTGVFLNQGTQLLNQLVAATKNGEPPEVIAGLTQQLAVNSSNLDKFVGQRILQSVGGDKRAAGYMTSFVYGTEMGQGTAAEAMTYFALKGNLPAGMSLTPEARQVFGKAQTLVAQHRSDSINGKPISEAQLQALVTRELTDSAPQIMGQARHDKIFADLPSVAQKTGHPWGKFDSTRWSEIRAASQMSAAESISHTLNTTPDNVLKMLRTGKPVTDDENGRALLKATQAQAPAYNGVELQTMVRLVDGEPAIQPGTRNSTVLSDYLGSPKFSNALGTYSNALGTQSIGEYLTNPMVAGSTEHNFITTRQHILDAQTVVHQKDRQLAQNPATNMLLKPVSRTGMIMSAIPGVGKPGAKVLQPFVNQFFQKYTSQQGNPGIESPNAHFVREDAAMLAALQATKFEDPTMESYRKMAIKGWEEHATAQQGFIQRLIDGVFGEIPSLSDAEVLPGAK